jgi:GTPase SAR1 family protein
LFIAIELQAILATGNHEMICKLGSPEILASISVPQRLKLITAMLSKNDFSSAFSVVCGQLNRRVLEQDLFKRFLLVGVDIAIKGDSPAGYTRRLLSCVQIYYSNNFSRLTFKHKHAYGVVGSDNLLVLAQQRARKMASKFMTSGIRECLVLLQMLEVMSEHAEEGAQVLDYFYQRLNGLFQHATEVVYNQFEKLNRAKDCNKSHRNVMSLCDVCRVTQGRFTEAAFGMFFIGNAFQRPAEAQAVILDNLEKSRTKVCIEKVLRQLASGDISKFSLSGLPSLRFSGFRQPPFNVPKFLSSINLAISDRASVCSPKLDLNASPQQVADWLCSNSPVEARAHISTTVAREFVDRRVLDSLNEDDFKDLFQWDCSNPRELLMSKKLWVRILQVRHGEVAHPIGAFISSAALHDWIAQQCSGVCEFSQSADTDIDGEILRVLSDQELNIVIPTAFPAVAACPGLLARLRALRNTLRHRLNSLCSLSADSLDRGNLFTVVVVGNTGSGKSTLLNAIVGEENILPTNCMRACTATIIEMEYLSHSYQGEIYAAEIEFLGAAEWGREVSECCEAISDAKEDQGLEMSQKDDKNNERRANARIAMSKLRSVYGSLPDFGATNLHALIMQGSRHAEISEKLGTIVQLKSCTCADISEQLLPFVDSTSETIPSSLTQDIHATTGTLALWPLVKRVRLYGPWDCLMSGLRLVDAPGVHDDNTTRGNIVRQYLQSADGVIIAANITRAVNDWSMKLLLPLSVRQALSTQGQLGQLLLVSTQTDVVVRSEIVQNLGLPEAATILECTQARNKFCRSTLNHNFFHGIATEDLPINNPESAFNLPVFTVSAVGFQKLAKCRANDGNSNVFTNESETEIPALRSFLSHVSCEFRKWKSKCPIKFGRLLLDAGKPTQPVSPQSMVNAEHILIDDPQLSPNKHVAEVIVIDDDKSEEEFIAASQSFAEFQHVDESQHDQESQAAVIQVPATQKLTQLSDLNPDTSDFKMMAIENDDVVQAVIEVISAAQLAPPEDDNEIQQSQSHIESTSDLNLATPSPTCRVQPVAFDRNSFLAATTELVVVEIEPWQDYERKLVATQNDCLRDWHNRMKERTFELAGICSASQNSTPKLAKRERKPPKKFLEFYCPDSPPQPLGPRPLSRKRRYVESESSQSSDSEPHWHSRSQKRKRLSLKYRRSIEINDSSELDIIHAPSSRMEDISIASLAFSSPAIDKAAEPASSVTPTLGICSEFVFAPAPCVPDQVSPLTVSEHDSVAYALSAPPQAPQVVANTATIAAAANPQSSSHQIPHSTDFKPTMSSVHKSSKPHSSVFLTASTATVPPTEVRPVLSKPLHCLPFTTSAGATPSFSALVSLPPLPLPIRSHLPAISALIGGIAVQSPYDLVSPDSISIAVAAPLPPISTAISIFKPNSPFTSSNSCVQPVSALLLPQQLSAAETQSAVVDLTMDDS